MGRQEECPETRSICCVSDVGICRWRRAYILETVRIFARGVKGDEVEVDILSLNQFLKESFIFDRLPSSMRLG